MANVDCAAAIEDFLMLENHFVHGPDWNSLVVGLPNPLVQDGQTEVSEKPGLDELDEDYGHTVIPIARSTLGLSKPRI